VEPVVFLKIFPYTHETMILPHIFTTPSDSYLDRYLASLRDPNPRENVIGKFMLVQEGEKAIPALLRELKTGNGSQLRAAEAIGEIGSLKPVAELLDMLGDETCSSIALAALSALVRKIPIESIDIFERMLPKPSEENGIMQEIILIAIEKLNAGIEKRRSENINMLTFRVPRKETDILQKKGGKKIPT